jgi:hypothetical protein
MVFALARESIAFMEQIFRGLLTLCGCRGYKQEDKDNVDRSHKPIKVNAE